MNKVKKFTSFEEMKSFEDKKISNLSSLKKHSAFKKLIIEIAKINKEKLK